MLASRLALAAALPVLLASPAAPAQVVAAPVLTINLDSYGYAPSPIHLKAGKAVTLHFVNRAGKRHDFTAERFFRSARILSGRVENGEIDLRGGARQSVTLVPAAGTYPVHCGRPFHKMMGMHSTILVH